MMFSQWSVERKAVSGEPVLTMYPLTAECHSHPPEAQSATVLQ